MWFIVAISVLVTVHEFGHYIVARAAGIKVLRFSVGFGKPVWSYRAGEDQTEYCISALPIGGYVKLLDEREGPVPEPEQHRAFNRKPVASRLAVLFAGPLFNFIFAVFAYWLMFVQGLPVVRPVVGEVAPSSYAADAGLRYADKIIAVDSKETSEWGSTLVALLDTMTANGKIPLTVAGEDGAERQIVIDVGDDAARLTEPGALFDGIGFMPWRPPSPPAIAEQISPGGAAEKAGLIAGDRIVAVDAAVVDDFDKLVDLVAPRPNQEAVIRVLRDGTEFDVAVELGSTERDGELVGLLGISSSNRAAAGGWYLRRYGALESISQALNRTWETMGFTVRILGRMITGNVSIKNMSGPISIAQYAGDSASAGLSDFLQTLALISISLGILNLLPIPMLDGGQILYQSVKWIKGSPMSDRAQIIGQQIGVFALVILMSFAFYNDIARLLS